MPKLADFLQKFTSTKPTEHFAAVLINRQSLGAVCWKIEEGRVVICGQNESRKIDWEDKENFLATADEVISGAIEGLKPEPTKVLFGVPPSWTENGKIKEEYLGKLKIICRELELGAMGFVTLPEAVGQYLKQSEGMPPTVILMGLEEKSVIVTLIKVGKIEGTKMALRQEDEEAVNIAARLLGEFKEIEVFPSRILLYDGMEDLEKWRQKLIGYEWTEKLPFLHFPRIEILGNEVLLKSLAAAGGTEMGGQISITDNADKVTDNTDKIADNVDVKRVEEVGTEEESGAEEIGFGEDDIGRLAEGGQSLVTGQLPNKTEDRGTGDEVLSSLAEEDSAQQEKPKIVRENIKKILGSIGGLSSRVGRHIVSLPVSVINKIKTVEKPKMGVPTGAKMGVVWIVLGIILLSGASAAFYYFWPKVVVRLAVDPKSVEKTLEVSFKPEELENVEAILSTTKKTVSSGKKLVGDKSKGEVTIYNQTDYEKKFTTGTILTGPNDLKFTLDTDIIVASASTTISGGVKTIVFGKTKASVTASQIGTKSNIDSGNEFSVADNSKSSYYAKNDSAFTGGTSREVAVVAKADLDRLLASGSAELKDKSEGELGSKLTDDQKMLVKTITSSVNKKKYDYEVDAESKEVSLNLEMKFAVKIYREGKIKEILNKSAKEITPEGYEFRENGLSYEITGTETKKDGTITVTIKYQAKLLPKINTDEIKKNIVGKPILATENYLRSLPMLASHQINFSYRFPGILMKLPLRPENITFEVESR